MTELPKSVIEKEELPDLEESRSLARAYIEGDKYVKASINEGYMSEEEYILASWVKEYVNLNSPSSGVIRSKKDIERFRKGMKSVAERGCKAAVKAFNKPEDEIKAIYEKSLIIRSRIIDRIKKEKGID